MMPAAAPKGRAQPNAKAKAVAAAVPKGKARAKAAGKAAAAKARPKRGPRPKAAPKAAPKAKAKAKAAPAPMAVPAPRPRMPCENPMPRVLHPLIEHEVDLVTTAFPIDDVARVVFFMLGCHCDAWQLLLRQMMLYRPGLLRLLTEYYSDARVAEGRRVRARIAYSLPLAVMPNGIVRSRPQ